ncbi:MAG: hypothetical protein P0Y66_00870 [Candidatus Kaistia colombiensis]|nr:MAG: hypothetical protein P0Y66_00870 [Kaistia sp.]
MFFLVRLALLYCVIGVGILLVQLTFTTCERPLVLDDGTSALKGPIELSRIGSDGDYTKRVAKDVVFWGPRAFDFVIKGDVSVKNFLLATDCKR